MKKIMNKKIILTPILDELNEAFFVAYSKIRHLLIDNVDLFGAHADYDEEVGTDFDDYDVCEDNFYASFQERLNKLILFCNKNGIIIIT
jgi:hypothetical protein